MVATIIRSEMTKADVPNARGQIFPRKVLEEIVLDVQKHFDKGELILLHKDYDSLTLEGAVGMLGRVAMTPDGKAMTGEAVLFANLETSKAIGEYMEAVEKGSPNELSIGGVYKVVTEEREDGVSVVTHAELVSTALVPRKDHV